MSSKDKTRQKLMGSMRKTKAVAGIGDDNVNSKPAAEDSKAMVTAKPVSVPNVGSAAPAKAKPRGTDGYQSGGRVWPD